MDYGELNLRWAAALVEALVAGGVREVVISPGSRSTPLTLAFVNHAQVRCRVIPDERSAAFFALGLARGGRGPVAVVATSGTAPANWYPAVIEAAYDFVPLVFISADRPVELQDCGANQTIDQKQLFGGHVRGFFELPEARVTDTGLRYLCQLAARAMDRSRWPLPGPVHLNVPLREPLVPATAVAPSADLSGLTPRTGYPALMPGEADMAELAALMTRAPGIIVCGRGSYGDSFPRELATLAAALGCPVFADPLSGLRFGEHDRARILTRYDAYLRDPRFIAEHRPGWMLRFGAMPTSKALQGFMATVPSAATVLVAPFGPWPDAGHGAGRVMRADPLLVCRALVAVALQAGSERWLAGFQSAETRAAEILAEAELRPLEAVILDRLASLCPPRAALFCGNSMVIRDVDAFLAGGAQTLFLHGNRGASGIDGNVSTALGLAAAHDGPMVAMLGDLALYHDMNGLLAARGLNAVLIVFNNGGGGIFEYLPQARLDTFEQYWLTPTDLELKRVAELYGLAWARVHDGTEFVAACEKFLAQGGVCLLEVAVARAESVARHQAYWRTVRS